MPSPHWTNPEQLLLRALAVQLRVLSFEQICKGWFRDEPEDTIRESIDALKSAGLVQENICEIDSPIELEGPLLTWGPGDREPDVDRLARISQHLETRWSRVFKVEVLYSITPRGANQFGSWGGKLSREEELTHDYHLSEVYLRHCEVTEETFKRWLGEMALEKFSREMRATLGFEIKRMKNPDAYVLDDDGKASLVVEFAGKYSVSHLQNLHRHCAGEGFKKADKHGVADLTVYRPEGTGYELW